MSGRLFVCATPIGNLQDVTLRVLRVLSEVDLIAAEDTRRTRKLLTAHRIRGKLVSYHEAREKEAAERLIVKLKRGDRIALVVDSGMPLISDPGYRIVKRCLEEGIEVEVVPGPSAVTAALAVAGLATDRFAFEGFLPRRPGELDRRLQSIAEDDRTLIFFEAPTRVATTLRAMLKVLGDRKAALVRELTKMHEEVRRGLLSELAESSEGLVGEVVLVLEGANKVPRLEDAVSIARSLIAGGKTKSEAAAIAASETGVPRRTVYEALLVT